MTRDKFFVWRFDPLAVGGDGVSEPMMSQKAELMQMTLAELMTATDVSIIDKNEATAAAEAAFAKIKAIPVFPRSPHERSS